jgi:C_GCAxxG_C_C family probable redox protein
VIDKASQRSGEIFESGLYCAESVLLAVCETYGIQSDLIPKIATGFCGGMSRTCGMCGAVSGAIMALSLFTGRSKPDESVMESYTAAQKLMRMFSGSFGSTNCRDLTGVDLGADEGQKKFKEDKIIERCKGYTIEATRMATTLIEEKLKAKSS